MAQFKSATEVQRERKNALRQVRKTERSSDSSIERMERRILVLLNRKSLVTPEAVETLVPLWNDFRKETIALEKAIADLMTIVTS